MKNQQMWHVVLSRPKRVLGLEGKIVSVWKSLEVCGWAGRLGKNSETSAVAVSSTILG